MNLTLRLIHYVSVNFICIKTDQDSAITLTRSYENVNGTIKQFKTEDTKKWYHETVVEDKVCL